MAKLITIWWRDIPSQIVAKQGRKTSKVLLSERFQEAIDKAAMRAKRGTTDEYLEDWRREEIQTSEVIETASRVAAEQLEADYSDERLLQLVKHKGLEENSKNGPENGPENGE